MTDAGSLADQSGIAATLIALTSFMHALFVSAAAAVLRAEARPAAGLFRFLRDAVTLIALSLWLVAAHAAEIGVWAEAYRRLGLLGSLEEAYYFAAVCFTTLGFGDVLLPEGWGLLAGANAANGFLLFGLSAAFLVEATLKIRLTATGR